MKRVILLICILATSLGAGAQGVKSLPTTIDASDASITKVGHATLNVKVRLVVDSLTMRVDTVRTVEKVEWNTEEGTAKKRNAAERRRRAAAAPGNDFYDKDTNWWWDMWWFSFNYPSVNGKGEPIMLSSLACMPDGDCDRVNNVVIGCHATITANRECPTMNNHNGLFDTNDTDFFMLHACSGWAIHASEDDMPYYNLVIIPDYEGYGLTKSVPHPYLSEELTARQVVDGVRYGIALYKTSSKVEKVRHPFRDGWRSFSVGYSQGGGTSMAVHRFIEQNNLVDELQFTGSICGAGPYNPMTTIMYYMHQADKDEKMAMAVVLPLILKGMCDSNPYMFNHSVSDYLTQDFLDTGILDWLASKDYSTGDIEDKWNDLRDDDSRFEAVIEKGGEAYLNRIMKPESYNYFMGILGNSAPTDLPGGLYIDVTDILARYGMEVFVDDYMIASDPSRPTKRGVVEDLHLALSYNDLTKGWNPEHPLYLYHSYYDDVVPLVNRVCAKNYFGDWVTRLNPSVHLGHVETALEFLAGTEEYYAVRMLASSSVHPDAEAQGSIGRVYKGSVNLVGQGTVPAEYVLRKNSAGTTVAVLGSGYNNSISQYLSGKIEVPSTVNLDGVVYPVGGVNDMAFRMCTDITHVKLPEGVERVGDFAFYACKDLLEVDLPSTLTTIGTGAFIDLPNLQSVICRAQTPPAWEYNDVFCFHEGGISDVRTYTTNNVILWVADNQEEAYRNANYTNADLGWTTPDGWGYFGRNIRSVSDLMSEGYAVYADNTLTFYYDGRKASRSGRVYALNGSDPDKPDQFPGWTDATGGSSPLSSDDPEDHSTDITRVVFSPSFYFARPTTTAKWFADCENLETIEGWENLNGSEVRSASFMFSNCKSLRDEDIDMSHFVTPKCLSFIYMFNGCEGLTTIDLSHFDTSSATTTASMFENCTQLVEINLNSFDTRNVTDFSQMFYNCSSLESLELEKLQISSRARVENFFKHCSSLQTLVLPFEMGSADEMFVGLTSMRDIYYYGVTPFSGWGTRHTDFMPNQRTRFHVLPSTLGSWLATWPNDPLEDPNDYTNVTYLPDVLTEECPLQIYNGFQWEMMNYYLEAGITDIYARLMADIKVTSMVGSDNKPFIGTFDGMGHTINCELSGGEFTAPFRAIGGATIKNLHVSGTITGNRHTGGIVGSCIDGMGSNTITNCLVDASLKSNSLVGGIVGHGHSSANTITGCLSRGMMTLDRDHQDAYPYAAGIIAWCDDKSKQTVKNCLDLSSYSLYPAGNIALNFANSSAGVSPFKGINSFFCSPTNTVSENIDYGVQIQSIDKTLPPRRPGAPVSYDVSGLTVYENGMAWNNLLVGGSGQTVPVVFDVPNGYSISSVNYCSYNQGHLTAGDALQQNADGYYLVDLSNSSTLVPTYLSPNLELSTLRLDNDGDNSADIALLEGKTLDVQLEGRTLYKDGSWNTLSLPFSLSEEQMAGSPLAGCTLATLKDAAFADGTLTLTFADTTAISADRSYLVRWTDTGSEITNPLFQGVTVDRSLPAGIKFWLVEEQMAIAFKGTYSRIDFDDEDKSVLFFGANSKLYHPDGSAPAYIGACRAYFDLFGLTADDLNGKVKKVVVQFNDNTNVAGLKNGWSDISRSSWYDVSGRRISVSSILPKGIYIHDGKKVVIQ